MSERTYPAARRGDDTDDYHGELIADPYRWLEDTDAAETAAWIKAQNELTEAFLTAVPAREDIRARLTQLRDYPKLGVPFERGGRWFASRSTGLQNQPVLYVMDSPDGQGRPLLDPNPLSGDGTVAVTDLQVCDDGSLLAYATSAGGSDWRTWRVRDVATGSDLDDMIESFYLVTDHQAGPRRVVAADLGRPGREHWREVIPETDQALLEAWFYGGRLVCHYLRDACSLLRVHELSGAHVRDVPFPPMASLAAALRHHRAIEGRPGSYLMHFGTTSFAESGAVWSHHLRSGETRLLHRSGAGVDPGSFVTEQVTVRSGDGTEVPMFLVRHRDVTPTGEVPVLLYGYGGFDVSLTPSFSVTRAVWMERGGLLAVANLRGGGEYGRQWHDSGRLASKQNVFDDFAACARWLSASGWSRPGRIAIHGRSNGGLLVGACLTQHPELFGAAVAEVGVFDMVRFHRFTVGWAWVSDFGNPDDPQQYRWLRGYSPLHNVRTGAPDPPTMLLAGDHDDRVVPGHSFKFAATLQAAQVGEAPILIRVDTAAGHAEGKPTAKQIAEQTDFLAFLEAALGATA